jgi:hypothetical protein
MDGLLSQQLNDFLAWSFDEEDVRLDFNSMSPYGAEGWVKFFKSIMLDGPWTTYLNSPSGQLYFKDGGKIPSFIQSMMRYFSPFDGYSDQPQQFERMVSDLAEISSGMSNYRKYKLMKDTLRAVDKSNRVTDPSVNNAEALGILFGIPTKDTTAYYETVLSTAQAKKDRKADIDKVVKEIKQYYTRHDAQDGDEAYRQAVVGQLLMSFNDDPEALDDIAKQLQFEFDDPQSQLILQLMKRQGYKDYQETKDEIRMSPLTEEQKAIALQRHEDAKKAWKDKSNEE